MKVKKKVRKILRYGIGPGRKERENRAKVAARAAAFRDDGTWERGDDITRRRYASYEAYVTHQASKLDRIVDRLHDTLEEDYQDFVRRFKGCEPLRGANNVLCLGARLGTEVRALHSLGYFAVGIDLNCGKDNPYVLPGDFHGLVFPSGSVEAVYTNVMDHVFDLDRFMAEVRRVLKPGGVFIVDMVEGYEEGYTPGDFEAMSWRNKDVLIRRIEKAGGLEAVQTRDLGNLRQQRWTQVVFRLPG